MPEQPDDYPILHRLALERWSTAEVALAAGMPLPRLQQRIKEGRLRTIGPKNPGTGGRRSFTLLEVYQVRLLEVLAAGAGLHTDAAWEVLSDISRDFADLGKAGSSVAFWPARWSDQWRTRDIQKSVFVVAKRAVGGWRAEAVDGDSSIVDALATLPNPREFNLLPREGSYPGDEDTQPIPCCAIVINMTRELLAVDRILASLRPEWLEPDQT
jgi:hypothetical protein